MKTGPVEYLAEHPSAWLASLAGAGFAAVVMGRRSLRARGVRRLGWGALSVLEALIFLAILGIGRKR